MAEIGVCAVVLKNVAQTRPVLITTPPARPEPELNRQLRTVWLSEHWWSSRWLLFPRSPHGRSASCTSSGAPPRSEHIHPRGLTALGSTLATWRRPAGMNSWGGCSPVRRRGSPSGAAAPAPQAAPATPVAANETPPAAPRVLSGEDLEFATVAEALRGAPTAPEAMARERAKVDGAGPLGRPVFAYLSALEPFVHLLSEGEEDEMSVHQWLVSVAWLTAIVVVVPGQNGTAWNPRWGGALHQLCEVWLNVDYSLQTTLGWSRVARSRSRFEETGRRVDPRTRSVGPLSASAILKPLGPRPLQVGTLRRPAPSSSQR